jgi:serine/threonine protein phosphatase PrpC
LLKATFLNLDNQIKSFCGAGDIGSTGCVIYTTVNDAGERLMYTANVGDTRAVLSSNRVATRLSLDHKPTEATEIDRVAKTSGVLTKNRLGGQLAVTRSFGDFDLKTKVSRLFGTY